MAYGKITRKELTDIDGFTQVIENFAKRVEDLYREHHNLGGKLTKNHGSFVFLDICKSPREKAESLERYVETMLQHEDIESVRGNLGVIKEAAVVIQRELNKGMMNDTTAFFVSKAHLEQEIQSIRANLKIISDYIAHQKYK